MGNHSPARSPEGSPRRKRVFAAVAGLMSIGFALLAGELLTRWLWHEEGTDDERSLNYAYDADLGWFPIPGSSNLFTGTRGITVQHNADGFRDVPHGPKQKPRIAFLGDSFVWGYDAEQPERFTDLLQAWLPDWEILNLGVSGYGTDQELLVLLKWFDRYKPDIVVLVYCDNDVAENRLNFVHGGYYKPYYEQDGSRLEKKGVPVPKSFRYYRREHPLLFKSRLAQLLCERYIDWKWPRHHSKVNPTLGLVISMKSFVEAKGGKFMIGFVTDLQDGKKRSFCAAGKIDYLFLLDHSFSTWDYLNTGLGHHWTPAGHARVCERLLEYLRANRFFDSLGPRNEQTDQL